MKMSVRLFPFFCRVVTVVQEQLECLLLVSIHWGTGVKTFGIQMKSSFLKPFSTWTSSVSAQVLNTRNCSFLFRKNSFHLVSKSLVFKECHSFIPRSQSFLKVSRHSFFKRAYRKRKKKKKKSGAIFLYYFQRVASRALKDTCAAFRCGPLSPESRYGSTYRAAQPGNGAGGSAYVFTVM